MQKRGFTPRELCLIGIFAALTSIMAQISIPMPLMVPMTMQTFAVMLAGTVLGARGGLLSAMVYLLLGALGVPVFASFNAGPGVLFGPTGGFLLSFPLMAWMAGLGAERGNSKLAVATGLTAGTIVNFICGMLMYTAVTGNGLGVAFTACVLPFIPNAIIKAVAAGFIGLRIRTVMEKLERNPAGKK